MINQPTPDIFQATQIENPQPQVAPNNGNALFKPIAEGVQALGDNLVALFETALNKMVNLGSSALSAKGNSELAYSTGRFEDPGFTPTSPIVAASTPAIVRGQSIEAPQISAPSRDVVSESQLGNLVSPSTPNLKGPAQGQSLSIS